MPFHDLSLKLVMVIAASMLTHHVLVARCASLGADRNASSAQEVLSNPSAPESSQGQSDLLDVSKLKFLADCKIDAAAEKICELYRNLTTVLSQRNHNPVTAVDVNKIITEQADPDRFCDNLSPLLQAMRNKHPDRFVASRLENDRICEKWCVIFDDDTLMSMHVKPICKVLLWGSKMELQSEVEEQDPGKQTAKVLVPPMLSDVKVENDHGTNPEIARAQTNITLPENTGKAMPPTNTGTDQKKPPSESGPAIPPGVVAPDALASQPTAASTPPKLVEPPADQILEGDDEQDPNELQNQENLKGMIGHGPSVTDNEDMGDDVDLDDESDPKMEDPQEPSEDVKLEQGSFDVKKTDSRDTIADQKAEDGAVHVERVEQEDPFFDQDDSNFFSYFLFMMFVCIVCYVAYHNKSKLLALVLEGRRTNSGRGGFNKGRKHTAAYRKLDSNLEEAITSNAAASSRSTSQIIY